MSTRAIVCSIECAGVASWVVCIHLLILEAGE